MPRPTVFFPDRLPFPFLSTQMCRTLAIQICAAPHTPSPPATKSTGNRCRHIQIQLQPTKMMRRGGSSSRGGHSGSGNRSDEDRKARKRPADPERARRVHSDVGRKRGAYKWLNMGLTPPAAYARREVEEYDRSVAARGRRYEHGSSSGAGSSRMAARAPQLPPPKREEEQEQQDRPPRRGLLPGDFAADEDLDWITEEVIQRSKQQEQDVEVRRQEQEELYKLRLRSAIDASLNPIIEVSSDSDSEFDWSD